MTESSANYCWQKQETLKGSCLPAGTAYGGWGFAMFASNRFYVYDPADEAVHVHVTCRRPWVTDRYFLRTSSGSLSPITVSELKSRSRRPSRATSPATAGPILQRDKRRELLFVRGGGP